jgi:predicted transposase YbfD/YdcC
MHINNGATALNLAAWSMQQNSSQQDTAMKIKENVRNHWPFENNLHWSPDVLFKEDNSLKRVGILQLATT